MDQILHRAQTIEKVAVDKLKPHPKNPNKHSDYQIQRLGDIIRYQGFRSPIVVSNLSGYIVHGHGRLMAAKKLGMKFVPVMYQDFEDETQEYASIVSDNAISEWAELDFAAINAELPDLGPDFDIDLLGIENFELEPADKYEDKDADAVPEAPKVAKSKLGDLWILGEHRLLCGDSTDKATVDRLMNGEKADMVFTDPPYGMGLDTDYSKMPKAPNGATPLKHSQGFVDEFSPEMIGAIMSIECEEVFIFGADYFAEHLSNKNKGSWIVWDKRVTDNFDKMIGSAFELCWSKIKHKREIARFNNTLFSGESDAKNKVHPTQKPIKLIEWFFDKWGKDKTNIIDLFGGSGSTLIACEKTKRRCFMMELDPIYIDVILQRWADFTGQYPVREDGTKWSSLL